MRMPAYAKALLAVLQQGMEPQHGIGLYVDRKPPDRPLLAPLAIFRDDDPEGIDWEIVRGRDVIIPRADQVERGRLKRIVAAVAKCKPRRLQAWSADGRKVWFVILGGAS